MAPSAWARRQDEAHLRALFAVPGGIQLQGVVEAVQPMRTLLRTDEDVLLSVPNKVGRRRLPWCPVCHDHSRGVGGPQ